MRSWRALLVVLATTALLGAACGGGGDLPTAGENPTTQPAAETTAPATGEDGAGTGQEQPEERPELSGTIEGAGASFPNPVFQEWAFEYQSTVQPGVTVNYNSIGSGGGIEQFLQQTIHFGSSERYLRDEDLAQAEAGRGCPAIQFPVLFGAVAIAFGDDTLDGLILSPEVTADIFERRITTWDDPAIAELNPGMALPSVEIIPVHRSDASGTTSVFTTYLDDAAENWTLGSGTEVQWPPGLVGGQGNEGVTAGIEQNEGGVGYVSQAYALINDLPTARVINADGNAVEPSLEATTAALEVLEIPDNFQFDILGVGGDGYPIVGANWIFTYECGYDDNVGAILRDYWTWATQSDRATELARELGFAPLGEGLRARVLEAIERTNSQ
jgi:phosphate transport system substrate-binding protein